MAFPGNVDTRFVCVKSDLNDEARVEAVLGGELPEVTDDGTTPNLRAFYGAQKVCYEYLVTDYPRKGYIKGRSVHLPTIFVRPGKPNLTAASFASGIIRELFRQPRRQLVVTFPGQGHRRAGPRLRTAVLRVGEGQARTQPAGLHRTHR
jgi:hypothetical protein